MQEILEALADPIVVVDGTREILAATLAGIVQDTARSLCALLPRWPQTPIHRAADLSRPSGRFESQALDALRWTAGETPGSF